MTVHRTIAWLAVVAACLLARPSSVQTQARNDFASLLALRWLFGMGDINHLQAPVLVEEVECLTPDLPDV